MESVGDDANEGHKFFKSGTIFVTFKSITFEIFGNCSYKLNNDLQEDLKISKVTLLKTTKVLYL